MDGKELEIKRRFKAGDMVVFRLGERENQTCPHCKANTYNSEFEAWLVSLHGKILTVRGNVEEFSKIGYRVCFQCGEFLPHYADYVLRGSFTDGVHGQLINGFAVYERELSPVNKNEMYRDV